MVKRPYFLVLIFLVTFSLVSCQNDSSNADPEEASINASEGDIEEDPSVGAAPDNYGDISNGDSPDTDVALDLPEESQPILTDEEAPSDKKVKKKRRKPTAPPPTCEELLVDTKSECYKTVPAGYDPDGCNFSFIENEDCDWEFICEKVLTEPPTLPPTTQASSSSSAESCETDRKISFNNCFINVDGFVKHSRAQLCD